MQVALEPADFNKSIKGAWLNSTTLAPANDGFKFLGSI